MPNPQVQIIALDPSRWSEYRDLRIKALELEPSAFLRSVSEVIDKTPEYWQEKLTEFQTGQVGTAVFAEVDGRLVGMIAAEFGNYLKNQHIASIVGVFVLPEFRGQGIAHQMMAQILQQLQANPQIVKIYLDVEESRLPAQALYKSFGFQQVGRLAKDIKVDEKFYDYLEMEKFLQ